MTNSGEQLKEAPDNYQRILHTFRATTEALLRRAELPEHSRDVVLRMMGEFYQAPDAGSLARQVFRNFRDATEALLECEKLPEGVHTAITGMVDEFANECGGNAAIEDSYARKVISRVFGLDDEDEEEAQGLTPAQVPASASGRHKEVRAEQFTLVDEAGAEHARLRIAGGGAVLTMMDSQGRPRLRLRAGDKEATITICGERGDAGKGVLPTTDEAERIRIGYDSSEQDARIVIQDGNENKRVTLSLDGDGAGVVWVESGDGCACIDERGMVILDSDNELLATYQAPEEAKDRPAAATEPAAIGATVRNGADNSQANDPVETENRFGYFFNPDRSRSAISQEAVRDLVDRIIPRDDDDAVKAFVALIDLIAYDTDQVERDGLALYACGAAYQRTVAYRDEAVKFFDEAAAESGLRASQPLQNEDQTR